MAVVLGSRAPTNDLTIGLRATRRASHKKVHLVTRGARPHHPRWQGRLVHGPKPAQKLSPYPPPRLGSPLGTIPQKVSPWPWRQQVRAPTKRLTIGLGAAREDTPGKSHHTPRQSGTEARLAHERGESVLLIGDRTLLGRADALLWPRQCEVVAAVPQKVSPRGGACPW
jgi:hypothetical protein